MHIIKKIIVLLIIVAIVIYANASVFAVDNANKFNPSSTPITSEDNNVAGSIIGKVLGVIKTVGISVAVVVLTVIGLKYMISSVDEKATYKENMVPYIAGCLLLVSASVIPSIVYKLMNS